MIKELLLGLLVAMGAVVALWCLIGFAQYLVGLFESVP